MVKENENQVHFQLPEEFLVFSGPLLRLGEQLGYIHPVIDLSTARENRRGAAGTPLDRHRNDFNLAAAIGRRLD